MGVLAYSDRFLFSLVTDVCGEIDADVVRYVVKYASGIVRATAMHGSTNVRALACQFWVDSLDEAFGVETFVTSLDAGTVWDLDVAVDAFLTGPL